MIRGTCLTLLLLAGLAGPVLAQDDVPVTEVGGEEVIPDDDECAELSLYCQEILPSLFFEGQVDSLFDLTYYWEDTCGKAEPITRTLILGAIWDRAFDELLYEDEIIEFLVWYGDPDQRQIAADEVDPQLASEAYFSQVRDDFDAFTVSLADQLLPHTTGESLEQFFCLFYSERTKAAWRLLDGDALRGTYLKRLYDWELERISLERASYNFLITAGYWMPSGNLALAGDHIFLGVGAEKRRRSVFGRVTGEILLGRADSPYAVDKENFAGRSDRFNAVTLALEGGYSPWKKGEYCLDVYAGAGIEYLAPFLEEDVSLLNFKGLVGVGYRIALGPFRKWFAGVDARREWMTDRNGGGTPLDGQAWSFRLSFGFNRNHDLDRRLRRLGH